MEEFLKLYFSPKRIRTIMHLTYILMCILIANKFLNSRGIYYSKPDKIDLPEVIYFVLSGQILTPFLSFIIIAILFHFLNKSMNSFIFKISRKRKLFKAVRKDFIKMGVRFAWFREYNNRYTKGKNYEAFSAVLKSFEDEDLNIISFAELFNTLILATGLNLIFYHTDRIIQFSLSFFIIGCYIFHIYNLRFLRILERHQNYFRRIQNSIEQNSGFT